MADAVDAGMLADECARPDAMGDLVDGHAGADQLPARHHPVRGSRDSGQHSLYRPIPVGH
ncbi:MAG TPA: hypothetical protein VE780_13350 [Thermoleophilaceae bacterium]|nr:hypothetical protein [Thermoleophilaceae bacterium]